MPRPVLVKFAVYVLCGALTPPLFAGELLGTNIIGHSIEKSLRYRRPRDESLGARVQLFVRGPASGVKIAGRTPSELVESNDWTWQDLDVQREIPSGALSVWTFNGRDARWGMNQSFALEADGLSPRSVAIESPRRWISAATFLSTEGIHPDTVVLHVANDSDVELRASSLRIWLPKSGDIWSTLWPQEPLSTDLRISPGEKGVARFRAPPLPLTYAALELATDAGLLWAHLRIKRETFDISGGWIFDDKTPWRGEDPASSPFLDLLCHLHVNTAHFETANGYSNDPEITRRYPLKRFHRLWPLEEWDTDDWLPSLHAVEFLGEPQYGGGRPVPPQEVFNKLLPYRKSRLATTVTHSEERIWRYYAGLSDYPHFDAYRVVAPAADSWRDYDRWGGKRISWGAPLETIGDLGRSLRDLNRPVPCAVWSQGPHHGWGGGLFRGGRTRRSPTPDELRSQAVHALSTRITSLYWFNLSLKSLRQYPDTWDPMTRIGREIKMLAPFYLEGDAYRFRRRVTADDSPDWDLSSICAPEAALLFAVDTAYAVDASENVFRFGPPRDATFRFELPEWQRRPVELFRVDADGTHEVSWRATEEGVEIVDQASRDRIYVAARSAAVRGEIELRRREALDHEAAFPVNASAWESLAK